MKPCHLFTLIVILFCSSSCGMIQCIIPGKSFDRKKIAELPGNFIEAENLLAKLKSKNGRLKTFKGLGTLKICNKDVCQTARVAWICSVPEKIRIEVIGPAGRPAATIASDGKTIYTLSHSDQGFYKKRTRNPNLKKIISIPLKLTDIILLLAGRVPVIKYRKASIGQDLSAGYVLSLENRKSKTGEKIYFGVNKKRVRRVEFFDKKGTIVYRAEFKYFHSIEAYEIPFAILITDDDEVFIDLIIDRYWADVSVDESVYQLAPPNN